MEKAIKIENIKVDLLNPSHKLNSFDCGDADMNDFLKSDALNGQELKTSKTHLFIYDNNIIGYITICCDSLKLTQVEKKDHKGLAPKKFKEFPAVKIARLGVDNTLQGRGIGASIVEWGIGFVLETIASKIGCRFITLDSLRQKVPWYSKRGFETNRHADYIKRDTISMRLDLHNPKPLKR